MTEIEMILEMASMQALLDNALLKKGRSLGKIEYYDQNRVIMALIDEIGELVHELKGDWCWWKATQKPVDRQKVLEELVDVWHFGLSLDNRNKYESLDNRVSLLGFPTLKPTYFIVNLIDDAYNNELTIPSLYSLTTCLGFTMEEVYNGYITKNKENYERIEGGY